MDKLRAIQVFTEVARLKGFAPAARELEISTSAVSRHVQDLEQWLGTQLLIRTTRQLNLTEAGVGLLAQCKNILQNVGELENAASVTQLEPQGRLRITSPEFMSNLLARHIYPGFIEEYPKIELDILITNRIVNIIEEGFDLAFRSGNLSDSNLIGRHLAQLALTLVVSPEYEKKHGRPNHPDDLINYNCIVVSQAPYAERWPYWENGQQKSVNAVGSVRANSGRMAAELAIAGAGVTLLPIMLVSDDIASGKLVSWLTDYTGDNLPLYAIYPQNRYISKPVRCFLDFVAEYFDQSQGMH